MRTARTLALMLFALGAAEVRPETRVAYIKPDPNQGTDCFVPTHLIYDPCSGRWARARPLPGVNVSVNPCQSFSLTGSWVMVPEKNESCGFFLIESITPMPAQCPPLPVLRTEALQQGTFVRVEWDEPPCVGSYDVVASLEAPITNPFGLDQFQCVFNDLHGPWFILGSGGAPATMTTWIVRGQDGYLATAHYGPASSGELRYVPNDCDFDP